jgi:cold shock CspA family protein
MGKSQESMNKKEKEKVRLKKKKDKEQRKEERKASSNKGSSFDNMIAYVDEMGNITSVPPDPSLKSKVNAEDIEIGVSRKIQTEPEEKTRTGIVSFFDNSKGFGFIKDSITKESIFVHVKGLIDQIKENDKVSYETEMGKKGLNAIQVKLVK